jgi:hypothetical protein
MQLNAHIANPFNPTAAAMIALAHVLAEIQTVSRLHAGLPSAASFCPHQSKIIIINAISIHHHHPFFSTRPLLHIPTTSHNTLSTTTITPTAIITAIIT